MSESTPDSGRAYGSGGGDPAVVACCVEGDAELAGVAADLGEEKTTLDACHGGGCERDGITAAYLSVTYLAMSVPVVLAGLAASVIGLDLATVATGYLIATALIATVAGAASSATAPWRATEEYLMNVAS
jgi:hypothetical protein